MLLDKNKKEIRMPLIPDDIIELKNISAKFNFYFEKFTDRIIDEKEYISVGCKYYTNQKIDLFLSMQGLKLSQIKSNQNYLVLFDVVEYVEPNRAMLNKILKNNCSLLVYDLLSGKHSIKILKSSNKEHLLKSTIYISKKLKAKLPLFCNSLYKDSIEKFYLSKKGYINFRYLNLLEKLA
tara:strand:- start:145 stop:684 length:540 start_codon:yes stop_codon:yes gene_type:complete